MRPAPEALAAWVVQTALLFGCSTATAHHVAALFVEAVEAAWAEQDAKETNDD